MAATAMLAMKPFTSVANSFGPVTGLCINNNSVMLAHTGNNITNNQLLPQITKLKNNYSNLIMLHAGNAVSDASYDASMHVNATNAVAPNDYRIVYKGKIKTGIITADKTSASATGINDLAMFLKNQKDCHLVVCLSQLGYKSDNNLDDLSLAAASTHIDVIIGGHADNFCKRPLTAQNKNKEAVIINHAADAGLALRKIEIGFDARGRKNKVAFTKAC